MLLRTKHEIVQFPGQCWTPGQNALDLAYFIFLPCNNYCYAFCTTNRRAIIVGSTTTKYLIHYVKFCNVVCEYIMIVLMFESNVYFGVLYVDLMIAEGSKSYLAHRHYHTGLTRYFFIFFFDDRRSYEIRIDGLVDYTTVIFFG